MPLINRRSIGARAVPFLCAGFAASSWAAGDVVISQVYGGGGNSGAPFQHDFVELYNRGGAPIDLSGWSVQYASSAGSSWQLAPLTGVLAPGQYHLVRQGGNQPIGAPLPPPDTLGSIAMSSSAGKVVLVTDASLIPTGTSCPTGPHIEDVVGYGTATTCSETAPAPTLGNSTAALRRNGGATDTDHNAADFTAGTPMPRNGTTTLATVTLSAPDPSAAEIGADPGVFVLTRSGGDTAQPLDVSVLAGGSATPGEDYTPPVGTLLTFPAYATVLTLTLDPVNDTLPEGTEIITLSVLPASGYALGVTTQAVITLADDDAADQPPAVALTLPANGATEVAPTTSLEVRFSEQVDTIAGAVRVACPAGQEVATSIAAANVDRLVIPPAWPAGATCTVTVSAGGVRDVDATDPPDTPTADHVTTFTTTSSVCLAPDTPIGQVQGTGTTFALGGTRTVQGVVVADYEGPDPALRGFYLQNDPAHDDDNPATSDALFIFNGNDDDVVVGQVVQVTGNVSEFGFGGGGGTQTQITATVIELCGAGGAITPVDLALPLVHPTDLERFEGMLVRFPQVLSVTEHFQLGRFGQVVLSGGGRLAQPTNIAAPGAAALAIQAANDLNRIVLDDALQNQNPDPIPFARGGLPLGAANTLRGGDTVTALQGVLTETDATSAGSVPITSDPVRYRIRTHGTLGETPPLFVAANPRPSTPPAPDTGALRVAGFNLLNYFNTFGAGQCTLGVGGASTDCRGADNSLEFERQSAKTVQAILGSGAAIVAINEVENDGYGPGSALDELVSRLNAASAPGTFAFIAPDATLGANALGTDAIKVGILYRPAQVSPDGAPAVLNTSAFGTFTTTGGITGRNRPALAQAFVQAGATARVVVVANHLKSKGSSCADNVAPVGPDPDVGDGQGECNLTRTAAASELAAWLATDPTAAATDNVLIMGDLNAYAQEDPVVLLENTGYVNLIASGLGAAAYSYVFDGQWGYLDHALAASALAGQVARVEEWHINADEPSVLDYQTSFKSAGQIASLYAPDVHRASDHDVVLVDLLLDTDGDGLGELVEALLGTDPLDADTDDDGLADGAEDVNRNGRHDPGETRADLRDTDGDGLADGLEAGVTAPIADPDGSGPLRGTGTGFVPDADPAARTDPLLADTDDDGFADGVEDANGNGALDAGESDPRDAASVPAQARPVPALGAACGLALALALAGGAVRRLRTRP
ncbi:MAG: ExeM/NucH family extracellular endonuclease [Gammaproteobacteria bacterium]